jgi:D-mannonate dehydratase
MNSVEYSEDVRLANHPHTPPLKFNLIKDVVVSTNNLEFI